MIKRKIREAFPKLFEIYCNFNKMHFYRKRLRLRPDEYETALMHDWIKQGNREFNISEPVSYREKMQWAKLYDLYPLKADLTDKVRVREWVKGKIGETYLIPLIGVYDTPEDIPFDTLPSQYVIKMNNSSGMNIIVEDRRKINVGRIKRKLKKWMRIDYSLYAGFQMHYREIKPKILIEQYLSCDSGNLPDYKFMCFGGKVYYCWVDINRFGDHKRNIYDLEWNLQPWRQKLENYNGVIEKPKNFDKMVCIAENLCSCFSHVRVDLYNVDGRIFFGEMTFTNGGGMDPIIPKEYDVMLGNLWCIEKNNS